MQQTLTSVAAIVVVKISMVESIVGGYPSKPGQFPYQVSVENLEFSICGGAILGNWHVVTAAHCIVDDDNNLIDYPLQVVTGIHHLASRSATRIVVDVEKIYVPKLFRKYVYEKLTDKILKNSYGDIAVLRLNQPLKIDNLYVKAVEFPDPQTAYLNKTALVSGYGVNRVKIDFDPLTNKEQEIEHYTNGGLRYAKALVISNYDCKNQYSVYTRIYDTQICAQIIQNETSLISQGVCSGDSGSPLIYNGTKLIGILNGSPIGCNEKIAAGIYVRVSSFINFIKNSMEDKEDVDIRSAKLKLYRP